MRPGLGVAERTALVLIVAAACCAVLGGAIAYRSETRALRRGVEDRAAVLADAIERSVDEAMSERRPRSLAPILAAMQRAEGVAGLALAGSDGRVRFAAGYAPTAIALGEPPLTWRGDRVDLVRPIRGSAGCSSCHGDGTNRGILQVSMDGSGIAPRLASGAARIASLVLVALAATAGLVVLTLQTTLARPLGAMERFAEALGRGDLAARPPAFRGRELGALATALRRMAEELERSHAELERRVRERTADLASALAEAERAREARAADLCQLQAILDCMADGVLFIDAEDRVAMVNKAGRVLRNLSGGPGRPIRECHPRSAQGILDRVLGYLRSGDDTGPAHSLIKEREGRYETTYAPVRGEDGRYLGTVMVTRDIAERRTLERRLLDAERLAGLGQMSAQIAHELRNPLNAIDGAAQYLRRRLGGDPEVAEYADLVGEEVQRVNRFVAALLHVARPLEPVFAPVNVNRLLRDAAQKAAVARGLQADAVTLDLGVDLPVLDVDAPMVTEAIVNLIQNAFEAGGGAPPELASRFEASGGEGAVVVEVRDRGCGIPPDQLEEVLRPFVTTKTGGNGLGLVVVGRAVEQHRARFMLASRDGGGTIATIRFPVRRAATPTGEAAA